MYLRGPLISTFPASVPPPAAPAPPSPQLGEGGAGSPSQAH